MKRPAPYNQNYIRRLQKKKKPKYGLDRLKNGRCMQYYKISEETFNFIRNQMTKRVAMLTLNCKMGQKVIPDINLKKGIFQGDSLSPLLFCLTLDLLSKILNKQNEGCNLGAGRIRPDKRINHKLVAENVEQVKQ